ncbi:alpha/beta fold hydrolase [Cohaesibacter gelatinilyticus]|uniref:Pimeloyl-ACP methyl ester carboxylesterase n=1 Tax=Cohaesibacter gelatinilyticus TaxID=372072 RepID=A0A285PIR7_9HYPH|nr:alpha/beta hydrolase [Cohaesibacter gelatinilyticus]SNZ21173.1 Pimeloyl-ACP methyl ester carboxylesterase [Cohaesibacter gelatinilyticus]
MKILTLPGLDGTGALLAEFQAELGQKHEVSVLSYPADLTRYSDLTDWIAERLPEEEFVLIAESFSGPLAAMIAAGKPAHLKGVIFVATFAKSPRPAPAFLAHLLCVMPTRSRLLSKYAQPLLMGPWASKTFTALFCDTMEKVPPATLSKRLHEVLQVNVTKQLHEINVPMLYLQASNDWLVPKRMAKGFAQASCSIQNIKGPHFLLQANPKDASQVIEDFIAELSKSE